MGSYVVVELTLIKSKHTRKTESYGESLVTGLCVGTRSTGQIKISLTLHTIQSHTLRKMVSYSVLTRYQTVIRV